VKAVLQHPFASFRDWLAWGRRRRVNKVLFLLAAGVAVFVTAAFTWATLSPAPGDDVRYLALYYVWGMCAIGLIFGLGEYKTSPLRKNRERGHLFILLYLGLLLIAARALNAYLYYNPDGYL
jgi:FtsH-binding integral membrane protein